MYNGVDILQTRHYIELLVKTFNDKVFKPYFATWMKTCYPMPSHSTPPPSNQTWLKKFNAAIGDPDPKVQVQLAKSMKLTYHSGVGKLIWAMTTCQPDLAYTSSIKLSQLNTCPHELHFHGLKHSLKFLYSTKDDGLYFWCTHPRPEIPEGPIPQVNSNRQDILVDNRPQFDAFIAHAYTDSDLS